MKDLESPEIKYLFHNDCKSFKDIHYLFGGLYQLFSRSILAIMGINRITFQKQSPGGTLWKRFFFKFCNIHRKTFVSESLS